MRVTRPTGRTAFESPSHGCARFLRESSIRRTWSNGGEGGIRTLGALLGHGALAKLCFQPLSHLTKSSGGQYAAELTIANTTRCARQCSPTADKESPDWCLCLTNLDARSKDCGRLRPSAHLPAAAGPRRDVFAPGSPSQWFEASRN